MYGDNIIGIMDELKKLSYITARTDYPYKHVNNYQLYKNDIIGETTCYITNQSATSIFNKLQTARHDDSTWITNIVLNIPTPPYVSSLLPPSTTPINTIDIVPFLQFPSVQLGIILRREPNYPDHRNFCLEGYKGIRYSDRLASNIIAAASKMEHIQRYRLMINIHPDLTSKLKRLNSIHCN